MLVLNKNQIMTSDTSNRYLGENPAVDFMNYFPHLTSNGLTHQNAKNLTRSGSSNSSSSNNSISSQNNSTSSTSLNRWSESSSSNRSAQTNPTDLTNSQQQHQNQSQQQQHQQQQSEQQQQQSQHHTNNNQLQPYQHQTNQQNHHHHHHHHNHQHQHQQHHHSQISNTVQQQQPQQNNLSNVAQPTASHALFGAANFYQRGNSSWSSLACYQKLYGETLYGFNQNNENHQQNGESNLCNGNSVQNNKRYFLSSGKSGNNKDICGDDKFKEDGDPWNVEAQAAFLGPNLWDKTLPYDTDLKVTQYADLDEFLSENNIPDGLPGTHIGHSTGLNHRSDALGHSAGLSIGLSHITKRERSPSPSDCVSPDTMNPPSPAESTFSFASSGRDFDPRTRAFSDEELKPQPMIKKSRKQFVPDELKDDKYWARRRKNNIAAKRSRDARRQKENQIAMRARYLEKENATLHQEVEQLKQENMDLRARLSKYQEV